MLVLSFLSGELNRYAGMSTINYEATATLNELSERIRSRVVTSKRECLVRVVNWPMSDEEEIRLFLMLGCYLLHEARKRRKESGNHVPVGHHGVPRRTYYAYRYIVTGWLYQVPAYQQLAVKLPK